MPLSAAVSLQTAWPAAPARPRADGLAPGALLSGAVLDTYNAAGAVLLGRAPACLRPPIADARTLRAAVNDVLARAFPAAEEIALYARGATALEAALAGACAAGERRAVVRLQDADDEALAERLAQGDVAALLAAPFALDDPAPAARLKTARRLCDRYGAALVIDERLSAPRCGAGGAQALWGVDADIAVYGPALANGAPFAALAGRRDLVEAAREAHPHAAPPAEPALAAAVAVAHLVDQAPVCAVLQVRGAEVQAELEAALHATGAAEFARVGGEPTAIRLDFAAAPVARFVRRELWARGVLVRPRLHLSYAWGDAEVSRLVDACHAAFSAAVTAVRAAERCGAAAA